MLGHQYYHQVLRKYVIMFGNLFNDIVVQRYNKDGDRIQAVAVPIAYGPREKFLARLRANPDLEDDVALQLPRMSFEMTGMTYAPQRKLNRLQPMVGSGTSASTLTRNLANAPYDIDFSLSIYVKNADDGVQITENILPFFTPEFTASMRLLEDMPDFLLDIPVVLQNITMEDTYEGDFESRRAIVYTLNFLVKGYVFGPTGQQGVINRVQVDAYTGLTTEAGAERVVVTPAQFANGVPTGNSATSVSVSAISANSDFGIAEDFFSYASSTTGATSVSSAEFFAYVANTEPRISKFNQNGDVDGHLLPSANITYDLGSPTRAWRELYLSGSTLHLANSTISAVSNGQIEVRDKTTNTLSTIRTSEITIGDEANNQITIRRVGTAVSFVTKDEDGNELETETAAGNTYVNATFLKKDGDTANNLTVTNLVLSTVLGPEYGGTGLSSVTKNGVLVGKSSSELEYIIGSVGTLLQVSSNGTPTFDDLDGGTFS